MKLTRSADTGRSSKRAHPLARRNDARGRRAAMTRDTNHRSARIAASRTREAGTLTRRLLRLRYALGLPLLVGGASVAETVSAPPVYLGAGRPAVAADISVLTYNVKGMPWPLASGRPDALRRIGQRLARMRALGRQPSVVVLQEAFTPEAKAIAVLSGYPFVVEGAYTRAAPAASELASRNRFLGETQAALVDSGLVILSDLPVRAVARAAFPPAACAGWDCLAAKGVAMVTLDVPGHGAVAVATVHFNCQGASGASKPHTTAAYAEQARFLARFLAAERPRGAPLIVAGDFNRGARPRRTALLDAALAQVGDGQAPADALARAIANDPDALARDADARTVRARARDFQFAYPGRRLAPTPIGAEIPFGTETDGTQLSDHIGYTVRYRLQPLAETSAS